MYFLSKSYQIILDRAVDTLCHGRDVVDGFNSVKKRYLATCLRMCITPKVDKIESKRMRVDAMTKKLEVIFPNNVNFYWIFVMKLVPRVISNMINVKLNHA